MVVFLGGPLAGFYFLSENFRQLGKKSLAKSFFWVGIIFVLLLGAFTAFFPEIADKLPGGISAAMIFPFLVVYEMMQAKEIDFLLKKGWKKHSGWRIVLIGLLCMAITIISTIFFALLNPNF